MAYGVAMSKRGPVRPHNEDGCCYLEALTSIGSLAMAVVCDGVGGLSRGELASTTVINRFVQWFECELRNLLTKQSPQRLLDAVERIWPRMLDAANRDLLAYGRAHNSLLATTFTGIMMHDDEYVVCHVGDCRLYRLRNGVVQQQTHDHTLVARELALGHLTPAEARRHPRSNVIYQAIGASESLAPEIVHGRCCQDDVLLLLTDGAYHKASEETLGMLFRGAEQMTCEGLRQACRDLLAHDLEAGETDNLSVVAMSFGDLYETGTVAFAGRRSA